MLKRYLLGVASPDHQEQNQTLWGLKLIWILKALFREKNLWLWIQNLVGKYLEWKQERTWPHKDLWSLSFIIFGWSPLLLAPQNETASRPHLSCLALYFSFFLMMCSATWCHILSLSVHCLSPSQECTLYKGWGQWCTSMSPEPMTGLGMCWTLNTY